MNVSEYMATIGRKGGQRSRRKLTAEQASDMAKKRWSAEKRKIMMSNQTAANSG